MPTAFTYPGVYVEEVPSGVRPISGVSTSDTAFVGYFARGPLNAPTKVTSLTEAERVFGKPLATGEAALQLAAYFANGGGVAWVVRVATAPVKAATETFGKLVVTAASEGAWGNAIRVIIDHDVAPPADQPAASYFNLTLEERVQRTATEWDVVSSETHRNITLDPAKPRHALALVNHESRLVKVASTGTDRPPASVAATVTTLAAGDDGKLPDQPAWTAGIVALGGVAPEVFNLLCLAGASDVGGTPPAMTRATYKAVVDVATQYCADHRAFLVVDPPSDVDSDAQMTAYRANAAEYPKTSTNAAMYFPRLNVPDPLTGGLPREIGPCGSVAGAIGRTDTARGIWKAPAGTDVPVGGSLVANLDDTRSGTLNVAGVNVIRSLPVFGTVIWGARTMKGADRDASEWKYVPVRRLALYLEESLYQGLTWVVFEPNDEPLWSSIRLNVGSFMNGLFRQGAFAGVTTRDAYFVRCDKDTTTQADIDRGVVNVLVGFKPLKPAEFIVLKIQQIAGQAGS